MQGQPVKVEDKKEEAKGDKKDEVSSDEEMENTDYLEKRKQAMAKKKFNMEEYEAKVKDQMTMLLASSKGRRGLRNYDTYCRSFGTISHLPKTQEAKKFISKSTKKQLSKQSRLQQQLKTATFNSSENMKMYLQITPD